MLRTVSAVEQRPWLLLAIVFLTTAFFGFLIQALGNVYLRWRMDPIVTEYRATLSYTSAVLGDGIRHHLIHVHTNPPHHCSSNGKVTMSPQS